MGVFSAAGSAVSSKNVAPPTEGLQNHLRLHALYSQLALLAGGPLPLFLAVDVRNVCLLHLLLGQRPLQVVADHKTSAVAVRQDDQSPLRRQAPEKGHLFLVVEHSKTAQCHHRGVHHLRPA